jgi:Alginate O-acetyl transferase AlgF
MKNFLKAILCTAVILASGSATVIASHAGDEGLYEKQVDPNSAFIRVVMPGTTLASVGGKSVTMATNGVSAYYAVAPGPVTVTTEAGEIALDTSAGKFYSVLPVAGKPIGIEDELNTNPAKAILSLYNLGDSNDIDVFVPEANVEALKDVGSGASKTVALKAPLKLDLVVRKDGKDFATLEQVEFKRLSGISLIITGSGDAMKAEILSNKIAN